MNDERETAGRRIALWLALTAIATGIILVMLATASHSHSVKLRDGRTFEFPWSCCTGDECAEISLGGVKQEGNGWIVDTINPKTGHRVRDFILESDTKRLHFFPEDRAFVCESVFANPDKTKTARCLYVPQPST